MTANSLAGARFDHIAIAVPDRTLAERRYIDEMGAGRVALARNDGIEIEQLRFGNGCKLELLCPYGERVAAKRLSEHIEQRPASIHHVTLLVDGLDDAVSDLASSGVACVGVADQPDGSREAFVLPRHAGGVLVQLVEKDVDDDEWALRHGQVAREPSAGAAEFLGARYGQVDLGEAALQLETLGASVTTSASCVTARWAGTGLRLWLASGPAETQLVFDQTPPDAAHPTRGPAVVNGAGNL